MDELAIKADLQRYLGLAREAMLFKLEGLDEYDQRRPLVATGTNLLGLVKHLATMEAGYFGEVFGRPFPESMPWMDDGADDNADMWASPDESPADIVALYARATAHADATIDALGLEATGTVEWWSEQRRHPTLHLVLVHMIAETNRHAGHADIVRELIDGEVGLRADSTNLPDGDAAWWSAYRARLQEVAEASGPQHPPRED